MWWKLTAAGLLCAASATAVAVVVRNAVMATMAAVPVVLVLVPLLIREWQRCSEEGGRESNDS